MDYKKYDIQEAKKAIQRYCTYQERSQAEVQEKLQGMGLIPLVVDMLMVELIENDYVNELRFAEQFAIGKFRQKGWGKIKIREKLRQRKVSDQCIILALDSIDEEEYHAQIERLAEWKIMTLSDKEKNAFTKKQKTIGFLFSRGFEYDMVRDVVESLMTDII
jgi:regulatory protein